MRLNKRSLWSFMVILSALLFVIPEDAFAQRRGGGSRSRPSARRSTPRVSKPRPKANTQRGKSTGKASDKGSWGSSKKKASKSKPKATKADQKAYDRAKANGTVFKDRKSASADFKKKNAAKYTSTYDSKPTTRPGHIPQTTMVGGNSTTIIYNQSGGGYGYWGSGGPGIGTFIMYNAMSDLAMRPYYNRQMMSAGYHYGPRPVVGMSGVMIGLLVVGSIGGIVLLVVLIGRAKV